MAKTRITLMIDEAVLRAVRIKAARIHQRESEVIEESLRRDLALDALEEIWARVKPVPEKEALDLAYTELHEMRSEKRATGGS